MAGKVVLTFIAGFASIAFPCVLPLVPGYLSTVSAVEPQRLGQPGTARRVIAASLPFIVGFTVVFVGLGALATVIADTVDGRTQQAIAGFVLVVAGLALAGLLPWTERTIAAGLLAGAQRTHSRVLLGGAFAVCAAPCVGPLLGGALALAGSSATVVRGSALLAAYSVGLGLAFLSVGLFFARGMAAFRWLRDHFRAFSVAGGAVLVTLGLLLFFDRFYWVQIYTHRALDAVGLGGLYSG
jgi:cytochrome c-type biogenesis protein